MLPSPDIFIKLLFFSNSLRVLVQIDRNSYYQTTKVNASMETVN